MSKFFQVIFEIDDDDSESVVKIRNMLGEKGVVYVSSLNEKKAERILEGEDD